jgi:hypothetical protein
VRPQNYRRLSAAHNESRALKDLEELFKLSHIRTFSSVTIEQKKPSRTVVEAQLWTALPFTLSGKKPQMPPAPWLTENGKLGVHPDGAQTVEVDELASSDQGGSPQAALRAVLAPDQKNVDDTVVLYLTHGDRVFDRYVYDTDTLFTPQPY